MAYEFLQRRSNGKAWQAGYTIWGLCAAYNHATNPALFLSDHEHARSRAYARAVKARMARAGYTEGRDWVELNNGMLGSKIKWPHRPTPLKA